MSVLTVVMMSKQVTSKSCVCVCVSQSFKSKGRGGAKQTITGPKLKVTKVQTNKRRVKIYQIKIISTFKLRGLYVWGERATVRAVRATRLKICFSLPLASFQAQLC